MKKTAFGVILTLVFGTVGLQFADAQVRNEMIRIGSGTFTIGSPSSEQGRNSEEGPQHQVTLSAFSIGKFPVTQAEYEAVMGENPSHFKEPSRPVEQVGWYDAVEYCNRRSLAEGLTPVYTINGNNVTWNNNANGYRLPTEAEWEYACRAGTQTPFNAGESIEEVGWFAGNSSNQTHPVGEKLPNAWGIYDMHGNVLEWCWDWFGNYTAEPKRDPTGPATGTRRVYRGGCWQFQSVNTRAAYRYGNRPNFRSFFAGFRVARSVF